jgi:hypothetical protein
MCSASSRHTLAILSVLVLRKKQPSRGGSVPLNLNLLWVCQNIARVSKCPCRCRHSLGHCNKWTALQQQHVIVAQVATA